MSSQDIILPEDILNLIADQHPFCWYCIAVSDKRGASFSRKNLDVKKKDFSIKVEDRGELLSSLQQKKTWTIY